MDATTLKAELDAAIRNFEKQIDHLQRRGMEEDVQKAINILSSSTLAALKEFRAAMLKHCS